MNDIAFEWDDRKNSINLRIHGVGFEEASSIFFDENGILIHDPDHSEDENRFLLMGLSSKLRLLVVSHTYRQDDRVIRLISERIAAPGERQRYGQQNIDEKTLRF